MYTPRWSPNGRMIAYVNSLRNTVVVIRPNSARVRDFPGVFDTGLGWSPDSRFIVASAGSEHQLVLLDVITGSIVTTQVVGLYPNWAP